MYMLNDIFTPDINSLQCLSNLSLPGHVPMPNPSTHQVYVNLAMLYTVHTCTRTLESKFTVFTVFHSVSKHSSQGVYNAAEIKRLNVRTYVCGCTYICINIRTCTVLYVCSM